MDTANTPSIKKNIVYNTLYQIFTVITPFITAPYISRVLGVENIGINSYLHSVLYFFTMFAVLGTEVYGIREISRTRDNKQTYSKLFFEIEFTVLLTSSIVLIGWIIYTIFFAEYKFYCALFTINIFAIMININWFYQGLEKFSYTVVRNFIVKLICIILILTTVKKPEHLYRLIILNTISDFIGNFLLWIPLKKIVVKVNFRTLKLLPHLKESIIYFIPTIATSVYQVLDKTLIGLMSTGFSENGYYEQTVKILNLVKALCYSSITTVMGTRISYLFSNNKLEEIKNKIYTSLDLVFLLSIGACFGLLFVTPDFVSVFYGQGYDKTVILTQILCFTIIIIGISICINSLYFIPAGLRKKSLIFEISGAIINLILNLILIPRLQSVGAAIGTICAESVIAFLYIFKSRHIIGFKKILILSYKKFIAAIIMSVWLFFITKLDLIIYIKLILEVLSGAFVYIITLVIIKDKTIFNIICKIRKRIFCR